MNDLNSFRDAAAKAAFGRTRTEAFEKRICVRCGKPIVFSEEPIDEVTEGWIYTAAGIHEYCISAMCEWCFDHIMDEPIGG